MTNKMGYILMQQGGHTERALAAAGCAFAFTVVACDNL